MTDGVVSAKDVFNIDFLCIEILLLFVLGFVTLDNAKIPIVVLLLLWCCWRFS